MTSRQDDRYTEVRQQLFGVVGVGIFLAIGVGVLGFAEKRGEFLVVKACFAGIALCLVICYWLWWIGRHRSRKRKIAWGAVTAAAASAVVGISFPWIDGKVKEREPPDVSLCFVGTQHPAIWAVNLSDVQIESAQLQIPVLFDVDGPTPDVPLQISPQLFDLISPHSWSGGYDLFAQMHAGEILTPGDRIVGSVGIKCAKCESGRSFYVSIIWGVGGWFSEIKNGAGNILLLFDTSNPREPHTSSAAYVLNIDAVPREDRIPIRDISDLVDSAHNVVGSKCAEK